MTPIHLTRPGLASTLLLIMLGLLAACEYAGVHHPEWQPWLGPLRAFAEAATVGACADWFTVVALFRRPLGLPIPHTAIIPRNQARIADGLGRFITHNFLRPDLVRQRLTDWQPASRIADLLADPIRRAGLARRLAGFLGGLIGSLDEDSWAAAGAGLGKAARTAGTQSAPALGRALTALLAARRHDDLIAAAADLLARILTDPDDPLSAVVAERSRWWMPSFIDRQIAQRLTGEAANLLAALRQPDHPWRQKLDAALFQLAQDLQEDPVWRKRVAEVWTMLATDPALNREVADLWQGKRWQFAAALTRPDGAAQAWLDNLLARAGGHLAEAPDRRQVYDRWLIAMLMRQVLPRRQAIGDFVTEVVRRWDSRTLVDRLQSQIGRDLHFIRVSGTLVGGLVGLILYGIAHLRIFG